MRCYRNRQCSNNHFLTKFRGNSGHEMMSKGEKIVVYLDSLFLYEMPDLRSIIARRCNNNNDNSNNYDSTMLILQAAMKKIVSIYQSVLLSRRLFRSWNELDGVNSAAWCGCHRLNGLLSHRWQKFQKRWRVEMFRPNFPPMIVIWRAEIVSDQPTHFTVNSATIFFFS